MADEGAVVKGLAVTPEQLLGYAYAGLLSAVIAAALEPSRVQGFVGSLGGLLASLAALGIGVGIYVLYFKVVGEFLIYPLQHALHRLVDYARGRRAAFSTSSVAYLGYLGVRFGHRRAAYEAIKAFFFEGKARRRIQLAHGELHVLYLTAVEAAAAASYLAGHKRPYTHWLWSAAIVFGAAIVADTRQHMIEASMLRAHDPEEVQQFLSNGGYRHPPQAPPANGFDAGEVQ
ncbi:MAG TPA: hypothetical protein VGC93_15085 [Thermoanaerobaculia bacterium]